MESLEKQNQPAKRKLLNYGWVFLSLLLFIFAIDLLTVAIGKINSGLALEILQATKNPFISLFIGGILIYTLIKTIWEELTQYKK